jgi:hypothetical protein
MVERRVVYGVVVGKREGKRSLAIPTSRWEDNIKIDLHKRYGVHGLDLSGSEYGQVVDSCECGNESPSSIKCGEFD